MLKSPSKSAFIDTPALDASILLAFALDICKTELILRGKEEVSEKNLEKYKTLIERRESGECIAYILGFREFRGLDFKVNPQVLVPRPDSETLVEAALEYVDSLQASGQENLSVLDLCTGCGALAISILNESPGLKVTASDVSAGALEIALFNAKNLLAKHPLPLMENSCISFFQSDLFEEIPGRFNIIVSNPPYIPSALLSNLAPEVRREPALALDGGEDGLCIIRKILSQAPAHLLPGGILLLEADPGQMPVIRRLLEGEGFCGIRIAKDLAGRDRVISAYNSNK